MKLVHVVLVEVEGGSETKTNYQQGFVRRPFLVYHCELAIQCCC